MMDTLNHLTTWYISIGSPLSPPDLVEALVTNESKRDLGIHEESVKHLFDTRFVTQGKSILNRSSH